MVSDDSPGVTDPVRTVLDLLDRRSPRAGATRVLCVDGPAGSGKTTLARAVVRARPRALLLHLDLLLDGWEGVADVADTLVRDVLEPLREGRTAAYRRYDWHAGRYAERVTVPPVPLLVVEGVGAGSRVTAPLRSASVWVEAPETLRRHRALSRQDDGDAFEPRWDAWATAERSLFAAEGTRESADLVVSTTL